jgi:uncharacterized membrane protein YfcA
VPQSSSLPAAEAGTEPNSAADKQASSKRAFGVMPLLNVVYDPSTARALSVREKWRLFYREAYDPSQYLSVGIGAGISQAGNETSGYGQGMQGYGKRFGAGLGDTSLGAFFGNFMLPSLLHDDPRYFRKGSGSVASRILHAAASALITHRDNGSIRPNYSNVAGNLIGGGIGNVYYPSRERGVGETFERGAGLIAAGVAGAVVLEFWQPGKSRKNKPAK